MLDKLLATTRETMPLVVSGIDQYLNDKDAYQELENSYQNMHSIIDVAKMLDLSFFCYIATLITNIIENIASNPDKIWSESYDHLFPITESLEGYLVSLINNDGLAEETFVNAVRHYRRLNGLPSHDDDDVIKNLVAECDLGSVTDSNVHLNKIENIDHAIDADNLSELDMDFSAELLEGFLIEAEDYLDTIGTLLPGINEDTYQSAQLQQVRRSVHTLKGAAGVVGLPTVSQLAHRMEDVLDDLYDGRLNFTPQVKELMLSTFDILEDFLRDKKAQGRIDTIAQSLYTIYDQIMLGVESRQEEIVKEYNINVDVLKLNNQDVEAIEPSVQIEDGLGITDNEIVKTPLPQWDSIRVPIHRLDEIIRLVGELVINRSVFEQHLSYLLHQVEELHLSIDRLQRTSSTIETQYEVSALIGGHSRISTTKGTGLHRAGADWSGIIEFDELEFDRYSDFHLMSRDLNETSADIGALGTEFRELLSEFDSYLTRQSRLTSDIQDKLMHFRMIPLSTLSTRLHRAVRVTAKQRNKEVSLIIEGEEVQFDKTMLDELNEALLHILRNAVDHGIETPEHRMSIGKSRQGMIRLCAYREGSQIVVQINDDGAGLNPERIRAKAFENGLVTEAEVMSWSNEKLYTLIFSPGFSTAQEVSEVSGRGVGMDIVYEAVTKLKGRINIQSTPGAGATLTIRLPVTLALTQVLLVEVNHQSFAIPLADVLQVVYIGPEQIETVSNVRVIRVDEKITPIFWLAEALNLVATQSTNDDRLPVVVMQIGNQRIAFIVDHLLGGREVVVKSLGVHLNHIDGLIGSTLLGDGTIVLILNTNELIQDKHQRAPDQHRDRARQRNKISEVYEILIVDDSFSVRRVVANLVKKAGWEPILAKNGLEALEILQSVNQLPDLVILDVEMPQMDGYELTSTLRAKPEFQKMPIVMLTSRAGDKHRQKAFEVGATDYIVKPYRDALLVNLISKLILESREYSVA